MRYRILFFEMLLWCSHPWVLLTFTHLWACAITLRCSAELEAHGDGVGAQTGPRPPPDPQVCRGQLGPQDIKQMGRDRQVSRSQVSSQNSTLQTLGRLADVVHWVHSSPGRGKLKGRIKVLWRVLGHVRGMPCERAFNCRALGFPQQCSLQCGDLPLPRSFMMLQQPAWQTDAVK